MRIKFLIVARVINNVAQINWIQMETLGRLRLVRMELRYFQVL